MRLADMTASKRREIVSLAAGFALADVTGEIATFDLAHLIAGRLEERERPADVARVLVALARRGDVRASKGEEFRRYGQTMRRWNWRGAKAATPVWSAD